MLASYNGTVRVWKRTEDGKGPFNTVRVLDFKEAVGEQNIRRNECGRVSDMVFDDAQVVVYAACAERRRRL